MSKYLQRKHFDIVLTEIRSLYFWIKVALTKILMIDFYNLQQKKRKNIPVASSLVTLQFIF